MDKIPMEIYKSEPERYVLKKGTEPGAPLCPYGNYFQWIGYDLKEKKFVRFTKSVLKLLLKD